MIKFLKNNNGIALVTSLMLTMISLTIIMAVFYMITTATKQSGALKRYRTALEASYGGSDLIIKDLMPVVLKNIADPNIIANVVNAFPTLNMQTTSAACLQDKMLQSATSGWGNCDVKSQTLDAKTAPDFSFTMPSAVGSTPYMVYTKIVDSVIGNSDMSGLQLVGAGVAEGQSVITPQHFPYVYRVEIQAERSNNATERANLSVLYAY